jgi:hypothetical protein
MRYSWLGNARNGPASSALICGTKAACSPAACSRERMRLSFAGPTAPHRRSGDSVGRLGCMPYGSCDSHLALLRHGGHQPTKQRPTYQLSSNVTKHCSCVPPCPEKLAHANSVTIMGVCHLSPRFRGKKISCPVCADTRNFVNGFVPRSCANSHRLHTARHASPHKSRRPPGLAHLCAQAASPAAIVHGLQQPLGSRPRSRLHTAAAALERIELARDLRAAQITQTDDPRLPGHEPCQGSRTLGSRLPHVGPVLGNRMHTPSTNGAVWTRCRRSS